MSLALAYADEQLTVSVGDDGCGFDPGAVSGGYGLAGLRARVAEVGGTAVVRSVPGAGTTVTVRLPVSPSSVSPLRSPR